MTSPQNRRIRQQKMVADTLHKGKTLFKTRLIQIIEEQTTNAALFLTMTQIKIVIAPFFEARVEIFTMRIARRFCCLVPRLAIFFETIIGR